jgi:hypothetical protein
VGASIRVRRLITAATTAAIAATTTAMSACTTT